MLERMRQIRTGGQRAISSGGRVVGIFVSLVLLAFWWGNGFAANDGVDAADASQAVNSSSKKSASSRSARLAHSSPQATALSQAIHQNTPGNSEGLPVGLSWDKGVASTPTTPAPSGFSALTGWAQVYQEAGVPVSPNNASDTVEVESFTTYVHLSSGAWVEVQNQGQVGIKGAHYAADFSGAQTPFTTDQENSDGSVTFNAPPVGYNDHFWPTARGTFTPGTIDGVFVEARMKTNNPGANLIAQLGADWWRNATAPYAGLNVNNTAVGLNDWTKLTTQWRTLYYTSLSPQRIQADPPPQLLIGSPLVR